jgi:hypothetical protein
LYSILQFLSIALFEKTLLAEAFQELDEKEDDAENCNQLNLWSSPKSV